MPKALSAIDVPHLFGPDQYRSLWAELADPAVSDVTMSTRAGPVLVTRSDLRIVHDVVVSWSGRHRDCPLCELGWSAQSD